MTATYSKYDILIVGFPFSSQLKEKARPVVVLSGEKFNESKRQDLIVLAVTSSRANKLTFEPEIAQWEDAGLLKPSILKAAIATIEHGNVLQKIGVLQEIDRQKLEEMLSIVLDENPA